MMTIPVILCVLFVGLSTGVISIGSNGTWRNSNLPCFGRTWRANYFEWTLFGVCLGIRLRRIIRGQPSKHVSRWPRRE